MSYRTFALTREVRGVPAGTNPPEHICTGGDIGVVVAAFELGAEVYDVTVGDLQRLRIGENITRLSADYRFSFTRET